MCREGPVLRTRGGLPAIWLCQDATPQPSRLSLTNTLAARQVHQVQCGAHLLSVPGGACRRGPRGHTQGSVVSAPPPPCRRLLGRGAVRLREQ